MLLSLVWSISQQELGRGGGGGDLALAGPVAAVDEGPDGDLTITARDSVLARDVSIEVDLAVLDVGMVATSAPQVSDPASLHLKYLQGEALPVHRAGYVDSNFLCFPFETSRTGVYEIGR